METGKGESEVTDVAVEETTPIVTEESPISAEEQLATLRAQNEELRKKYEQTEKGLNTAQATLTRKDKEAKAQADINARLDGMDETNRILVAMMNEKLGEMDAEQKTDYLKQFDTIQEKQRRDRESLASQSQQEEYNSRAQAIYNRANEVYPDDDARLLRIERCLDRGNIADAEALVAKAEKRETKVESEEDLKKKWIEEGKRLALEEGGKLTTSTTQPSGAIGNDEKWLDEQYSTGKDLDHARAQKVMNKMKQGV